MVVVFGVVLLISLDIWSVISFFIDGISLLCLFVTFFRSIVLLMMSGARITDSSIYIFHMLYPIHCSFCCTV